jgi:hypothetical protein
VLEHGSDWQHSHWLLTLNYTATHPRRHAHGRLVALNSSATPCRHWRNTLPGRTANQPQCRAAAPGGGLPPAIGQTRRNRRGGRRSSHAPTRLPDVADSQCSTWVRSALTAVAPSIHHQPGLHPAVASPQLALMSAFDTQGVYRHGSISASRARPHPEYKEDNVQDGILKSYIGGRYIDNPALPLADNFNPANGELLCKVQQAGAAEAELAVKSAEAGFAVWSEMTGRARPHHEQGGGHSAGATASWPSWKCATTARFRKPRQWMLSGADCIEYFAGMAAGIHGEHFR